MQRPTHPIGADRDAHDRPAPGAPLPSHPGLRARLRPAEGHAAAEVLDELDALLVFLAAAELPLAEALRAAARALTLPPLPSAPAAAALTLSAPGLPPVEARADRAIDRERPAWGRVDLVDAGEGWGLVRLVIAPGATLPNHQHAELREWERVLTAGLLGWSGGGPDAPLPRGAARCWPHGLPHGYHNPTEAPQALLCLNRPAFIPSDEIVVPRVILPHSSPPQAGADGQP